MLGSCACKQTLVTFHSLPDDLGHFFRHPVCFIGDGVSRQDLMQGVEHLGEVMAFEIQALMLGLQQPLGRCRESPKQQRSTKTEICSATIFYGAGSWPFEPFKCWVSRWVY